MNHHEAKFLLRARRPGGADAKDPVFAEALAETERDPTLRAWLESEAAFDRAMAAKLREIQPPPGLHDAILAGSRASQRQPASWWKKPAWLAVAASIAIILTLTRRFSGSDSSTQAFASYALQDLAVNSADHANHRPEVASLAARFTNTSLPLPGNVRVDAAELRRLGCRTLNFAGHEVFEICFKRDGHWYHLYAANVHDFSHGSADAKALLTTKGRISSTAWKDGNFAYALVTDAGPDALRRLI
ncbi:MAG TPA: hypothetical protein VGM64_02730 [Lacunisphaera sp.]|jgi:hypothetical protein